MCIIITFAPFHGYCILVFNSSFKIYVHVCIKTTLHRVSLPLRLICAWYFTIIYISGMHVTEWVCLLFKYSLWSRKHSTVVVLNYVYLFLSPCTCRSKTSPHTLYCINCVLAAQFVQTANYYKNQFLQTSNYPQMAFRGDTNYVNHA